MFFTVEGCNGSGKSFFVDYLVDFLEKKELRVFRTKEPSSKFNCLDENIVGSQLFFILIKDRDFHINNEIIPALQEKRIVVCDRYIESTLVYQRLDGLSLQKIWSYNKNFPIPDLCFFIDTPDELIQERLLKRKHLSRFENDSYRNAEKKYYEEAISFLQKQRFNYFRVLNFSLENTKEIEELIMSYLTI
ncbi:dTMP kinase [Anabaena sp. UHCC 0204]|uniref:dTMP kinase n=1 Tax=Anabaena sp. UHCC 0204 TaxID=2590009 RepID=UPI0014461C08|nr:dTMP kinase [Anabaena sp. UHCC 0204]MTJ10094.1 dTMP kinase [Anabaena sp. UHCC 0204]